MPVKHLESKAAHPFWHQPIEGLLEQLHSNPQGLAQAKVEIRLEKSAYIL